MTHLLSKAVSVWTATKETLLRLQNGIICCPQKAGDPIYEGKGFSQCRNVGRVPLFMDGASHCKYLGFDTPWNVLASYKALLLFLILCILLLSELICKRTVAV